MAPSVEGEKVPIAVVSSRSNIRSQFNYYIS